MSLIIVTLVGQDGQVVCFPSYGQAPSYWTAMFDGNNLMVWEWYFLSPIRPLVKKPGFE